MGLARVLRRLDAQFAALGALAASDPRRLAQKSAVSAWTVGNHLEHLLRTDRQLLPEIETLLEGDGERRGGPILLARISFLTGFVPRGRGMAPPDLQPKGQDPATIAEDFQALRTKIAGLDVAAVKVSRVRRPHFALGMLCAADYLRVMDVHHRHHMRIVADIERAGMRRTVRM